MATTPLATPAPNSVSGDFLNFAPARGWNYLVTNVKNVFTYPNGEINPGVPVTTGTISLYVYPTPIDGTTVMLEVGVAGQTATALTAPASQQAMYGAAGFSTTGSTYTATRYAAFSATAAIPSTIVVSSPLVLGAASTPFVGVTETVTAIGLVPGESACPTPTALGATVQYTYGSQTGTIDYVPGCGATQIIDNKGETWTLQSIGSYPTVASNYTITAVAQQVAGANALDTIRSILGLEKGGAMRRNW